MTQNRRPRVSLYALGCRVNQYEVRQTAEELLRRGYRIVPFGQPADVCVVNTCSVTDQADVKSRSVIRRAGRVGDDPIIVATGCYADVAPAAVQALPNVTQVVPNAEKARLADVVDDLVRQSGRLLFDLDAEGDDTPDADAGLLTLVPEESLGRTRAVIKIQDGCNHFCSFCIIPYARGRLRSRPAADVLAEARRLSDAGYREVVLAGICLGDYGDERGFDRCERDPLALLLEELSGIPGIARIRLSSIDPCDVTADLIEALATLPRVCRHLHLSLQSGDEEVLRRMRRRYTAERFRDLCDTLHARVPGIGLTSDIIAGFPGETEEQFEASYRMAEDARFRKIHVFKYSPRSGTQAARWPDDIPPVEKERRSRRLIDLSNRLSLAAASAAIGETVQVLVENRDRGTGLMTGLTDDYLRVHFDGPDSLRGEIVPVEVQSAGVEGVYGVLGVQAFRATNGT